MKPPTEMARFRDCLEMANHIVILTGAGVSAESGIPTFRGAGGFWRRYQSSALASAEAFRNNPSLVWEFYQYRRDQAYRAVPNPGHVAIARFEQMHSNTKTITVITQNVDGLHRRAGSRNLIELHGNLFKTRCTKCKEVLLNYDNPICEGLSNVGPPDLNVLGSTVRVEDLPHCRNQVSYYEEADSNDDPDSNEENEEAVVNHRTVECGALLRPHIVWFGEGLEPELLEAAETAVNECDVCLICGTSSNVFPAASLGPQAAAAGAIVAEFNTDPTEHTPNYPYFFQGLCGTTLPEALAPFD